MVDTAIGRPDHAVGVGSSLAGEGPSALQPLRLTTQVPIHLSQQLHATARTDRTSPETRFNNPAPKVPKSHPIKDTLWH